MGLRETLLPTSLHAAFHAAFHVGGAAPCVFLGALSVLGAVLTVGQGAAEGATGETIEFAQRRPLHGVHSGPQIAQFRLDDAPLGATEAPTIAPHSGSHGGTVAVDAHGVLVLDRDSGTLSRTDRDGNQLASLTFGSWAGELVRDGASEFAYVADRTANRVVRIRAGEILEVVDKVTVHEPHGLALSPDGKTLYVTSVANHELVALDTETMHPLWRVALAAEPRGVAVAASGKQAIVGFLVTGALATVELGTNPNVSYISLNPAQRVSADPLGPLHHAGQRHRGGANFDPSTARMPHVGGSPSLSDTKDIGLRFARNTFAVAYVGNELAIAPHQLSTPHMPSNGGEDIGTYGGGGGFTAPITHRMAMIDSEDSFSPKAAFAEIGLHQPRALAYDAASDTLYLAGYGNDQVMAVADVSQNTIHMSWSTTVQSLEGACAPDGLAVAGDQLFVHCELDRNLVRLDVASLNQLGAPTQVVGPELASSTRSPAAQRGAELFRRGRDPSLSVGGFMACASCHAEGRTDGLSWRIEGHNLQTPVLAGRLLGTHPFKWDGKDHDLPTSLSNTIGRLGGSGLLPEQIQDLQAFLQSLPQPVPPSIEDRSAIVRGEALFQSVETGCTACHDGPRLADGVQHDFATNIGSVDTPSLIGLAHSAPYYHDGSARTLRALLTDKASVHGMGQTAQLSSTELDDLIAYLESL